MDTREANTSNNLSMKPGSAMNKLIAEKIMGYKPVPINHWLPEGTPGRGNTPSNWLYTHPIYGQQVLPMHHFDPSRNIESAWKVIKKLEAEGYNLSLKYDARILEKNYTIIFNHILSSKIYTATAKEVEEAICKAALLTTEGNPKMPEGELSNAEQTEMERDAALKEVKHLVILNDNLHKNEGRLIDKLQTALERERHLKEVLEGVLEYQDVFYDTKHVKPQYSVIAAQLKGLFGGALRALKGVDNNG